MTRYQGRHAAPTSATTGPGRFSRRRPLLVAAGAVTLVGCGVGYAAAHGLDVRTSGSVLALSDPVDARAQDIVLQADAADLTERRAEASLVVSRAASARADTARQAELKAAEATTAAKAAADAAAAQRQAEADRAARDAQRQSVTANAASDPKAAARAMLADFGFADSQFSCLSSLWTRESNWTYTATNSSSGAYGIPQSLPASKMASAGADYRTNPATQITWGLGYIKATYGTPCGAWSHSQATGWY